jgi:hypothetical protein
VLCGKNGSTTDNYTTHHNILVQDGKESAFSALILRETESLRMAKRVDDPGMMVFSHRRGQCKRRLLKWGKNRIIVAQRVQGCLKGKERDLVMT